MATLKVKNIWITGASSGLGRSLALMLAARGNRVYASARSREQLEQLASFDDRIVAVPCDITDESSIAAAISRIEQLDCALDQVILNAGNCEYLDFPQPDWSAIRRVMEINFFGTVSCVQQVLPLLRQGTAARPQLVVIASQVTAAPFARAEAYGASKAALQYFFASLRLDLARDGIDVSVVNPGFVDTPLTRKNDFPMPFLMTSDQAARRIVNKLTARPHNYWFPRRLSALLLLSKLAPRLWQKLMLNKNGELKKGSNYGVEP